ncbi:hypothetical protein R1sor_007949 [Riccia sorocarpa]|uniref:Thioesterase domain-containing protein n=1 Tax=Riccia sorocarpa TaxID=122646 RepID=A0ABD3HSC2_9MARC
MLRLWCPTRYLAISRSIQGIRPRPHKVRCSVGKIGRNWNFTGDFQKCCSSGKFVVPLPRGQVREGFQFRLFAMQGGGNHSSPSDDPLNQLEDDRHKDYRGLKILQFIGFKMTQLSPTKSTGRFVVTKEACQPFNVLHGGTTAYIAESIASVSATIAANYKRIAGIELNVSHLRSVPLGSDVEVTAVPLRVGNRVQVWEVKFETTRPERIEKTQTAEQSSGSGTSPQLVVSAIARVTLLVGLPVTPESKL